MDNKKNGIKRKANAEDEETPAKKLKNNINLNERTEIKEAEEEKENVKGKFNLMKKFLKNQRLRNQFFKQFVSLPKKRMLQLLKMPKFVNLII